MAATTEPLPAGFDDVGPTGFDTDDLVTSPSQIAAEGNFGFGADAADAAPGPALPPRNGSHTTPAASPPKAAVQSTAWVEAPNQADAGAPARDPAALTTPPHIVAAATTPPAGTRPPMGRKNSIQKLDAYRDNDVLQRQVSSAQRSYSRTSSSSSLSHKTFKAEAFSLTHSLEDSMASARHASVAQRKRPSEALGALAEVGEAAQPGGLAILRLVHQCATQTPKFKRSKSAQAANVKLRKVKRDTVKTAAKRAAAEADELLLIERLKEFLTQGFTVEDLNKADDKTGDTPLHLMAAKNLGKAIEAIVQLGASVEPCNHEGITPLLMAAQHGAENAARALLLLKANPRLASTRGELPLHEALMRGHYLTAEMMLLTGCVNVDTCNAVDAVVGSGKTEAAANKPLMYRSSPLNAVLTAKTGADLLACCRVLCKYGPSLCLPDLPERGGLTPLEQCLKRHTKNPGVCGEVAAAARHSDIAIPSTLLEKTELAGVAAPELTMLWAFFEAGCTQAVAALLDLDADIKPPVSPVEGKPERPHMLQQAIATNQVMLARPLLGNMRRSGVDLAQAARDAGSIFPRLPFEVAAHVDPLEVRWWIGAFVDAGYPMHHLTKPPVASRGASKDEVRAFSGETSLLLELIKRGHVDAAMALWDSYDAQGLTVNANEADDAGCSLLFYSVYRRANNDRTILTQRLVKAGCDRTHVNRDGVTPLLAACRANNMRGALVVLNRTFQAGKVEALHWRQDASYPPLADPAQLNMKDGRGNSPLFYATMHGNAQLAALLLHNGADPNLMCGIADQMTPLHLAVRRDKFGSDELVSLLLAFHADPTIRTVSTSKYGGGLTALDFSYMNEYPLTARPMTDTLARYAGAPMENFLCSAVLNLHREDLAFCATHDCDDGYRSYKEDGKTKSGALIATYAKAYKHCPPYTRKIADIAEATYENGKELIAKLSKAKLKVNGAKLTGVAVKVAVFAAKYTGVAGGMEGMAGDIIGTVIETIIDLMVDALIDMIVGVNTDLMGACLDFMVQAAEECISITQQNSFALYYKDINVSCAARFESKEAQDKTSYYNPMTWVTKADIYKNGIREFIQEPPSKKKPLRLRGGERVVTVEGRTGTALVDLGPSVLGPQYIIEMDDTSEHLAFPRDSVVSLDVLEKKARGEVQLSLSLDDTGDRLHVAVADTRGLSKDKSKGNFVRVSVDNASLKNAAGKAAKSNDLVCDVGKSITLHGLDSRTTKTVGVVRIELLCTGRGGMKKLVGGVAIPVRDLVRGDGPDDDWTPIYANYDVPTEEQLREGDTDGDEDEVKPPAEIPPWEGESRFGYFDSDKVEEAMLRHIEARMAAEAPHFDGHHLRPEYPRLDWTTPHLKKPDLKLLDKLRAAHDKKCEGILSSHDKSQKQLQGKLASCQWFSPKAREKQIKKSHKALLKSRAKERKMAKAPKLTGQALEEETQATLAEAEALYQEQNKARCYLAASAMERLRLHALIQLLHTSLETADTVRAEQAKVAELMADTEARDMLDGVHQQTERKIWSFYTAQVHDAAVFATSGLLDKSYEQEVELNRSRVLSKAHSWSAKPPKHFDVEVIHRRSSNLAEEEVKAFMASAAESDRR